MTTKRNDSNLKIVCGGVQARLEEVREQLAIFTKWQAVCGRRAVYFRSGGDQCVCGRQATSGIIAGDAAVVTRLLMRLPAASNYEEVAAASAVTEHVT